MALVLRAVDVSGRTRWQWLLVDDDGRAVADHEVDLDAASVEFEAFCDLDGYLSRNRVPDDRVASEAAIVARVGAWIGERVLGRSVGAGIVAGDDDTVRVEVPVEADFLLNRPVELAHIDGVSLARRGVSLVYGWGGQPARKEPVGDSLRILALFSMPSRTSAPPLATSTSPASSALPMTT